MNKKIFCKNCEYHIRYTDMEFHEDDDLCMKPKLDKLNCISGKKDIFSERVLCREKNKKYNCKDFKQRKSFWTRWFK
jgi:hypothetical protein